MVDDAIRFVSTKSKDKHELKSSGISDDEEQVQELHESDYKELAEINYTPITTNDVF